MIPHRLLPRAAAAIAVLLCAIACAPADEDEPLQSSSEFSQLTDAGIAQIKKSRHARFDLRNHELTKTAVGLDRQGGGPIIGGADRPTITLELLGPAQTETIETSTMMFLSYSGEELFDGIVWWESFDDAQQALDALHEDITRWGLSPKMVGTWEENIKGQTDYQQVVSMGVGRSGLVVDAEAYLRGGRALIKYDIYLAPKYYTPEVQDTIRRTGYSH